MLAIIGSMTVQAQTNKIVINKTETERIEKYLSSDELAGRKTFSPGIEKAANFIANEFQQAGLAKLALNTIKVANAQIPTLKMPTALRFGRNSGAGFYIFNADMR